MEGSEKLIKRRIRYKERSLIIRQQNSNWAKTPRGRYSEYKKCAKSRNISFDITFEQFIRFWNKQCHYCGCHPDNIGLDRLDNTKGYSSENIVSCCKICNQMKADFEYDFFIERCSMIHLFNN